MNINRFRCKPTYLDFPILQITYIILWIPLGFIVSYFLAFFTINAVAYITMFLLERLYYPFQYYLLTGGFELAIRPFYLPTNIIYDFLILFIGLELISKFLDKKRIEFEGHSDDEKDLCNI